MSDEVNSLSIIEKADMTSFKQSMVKNRRVPKVS